MFNRFHSYNNYLIHVFIVLYSAVEPMTTLSWQLCKQACSQVGYACILKLGHTVCVCVL